MDGVERHEPVDLTYEDGTEVGQEEARLEDILDRIADDYRQRSDRVIVEAPPFVQTGRRVVAPVPHDLDSVVARLKADEMRKLKLAAAMAGGPVVVGRFEDDGRLALRQRDKKPTRVVRVGGRAELLPPLVGSPDLRQERKRSGSLDFVDRWESLNAVARAGYEVAPVDGDPLSYSYDKPARVKAYEEAFGTYVGGSLETDGVQAMLGPVEGAVSRGVMYFHDDQQTQVMSIWRTNEGWPNRGVMLWLRA